MTRAQWALVSTASVSVSFLWALACNFVIEFMQSGGNMQFVRETLADRLPLFVLGATILWTVLLLVWGLSGRLWLACAVLTAISLPLAYANYQKVTLRLEPLYPSDFQFAGQAGFLREMVGVGTIVQVVTVVLLLVLVLFMVARVLRRTWRRTDRRVHPRRWRVVLVARVLVVVMAAAVLFSAAHFNDTGNPVRRTYEASGASWAFWFQKLNYQRNGFVGGMLYNLNTPAMEKPAGYSRAAMDAITSRYAGEADAHNAGRSGSGVDDYNVVVILSEAFSDPSKLTGVEYAEDPIPYTRGVMDSTTSGTMLAQLFGGGTANMEFEVLTGMSLSQFMPQMQTPYSMLVPKYDHFPSAVGLVTRDGHDAIAMHPYMTSMYKREEAYPVLGFERFLGQDDFQDATKIDKSDFISDASAFQQVQRELDRSDAPMFVNLVTMQNHYPMKDLYDDPLPVTGVCCEYKKEAEGYGRGLAYTDAALKDFLAGLEKSDEKTAVIFYGDHQPAFWPEAVRDKNGEIAMRSTPYFVWANTPIEKADTPAITSPIYFLPMLYDALGAQLPPYYALLRDLQEEIPAMEQGVYLDDDGNPVAEKDLSPRAKQLLHDYRLVQYDLSVGARYSQDDLFYPASVTSAAAE